MEAREIQPLTTAEIENRLRTVQEELFNLRFQLSVGQLENFNRLTQLKRDIARLKTELRQRALAAETAR
jgi:large subunit ribosomal protein L29